MNIKLLSLVMALIVVITSAFSLIAYADDTDATQTTAPISNAGELTTTAEESTTSAEDAEKAKQEAQAKLEKQQQELEKNLEEAEKRLAELEKTSKVTAEYIDTLDRKIGYINEQLTLLEEQNLSIQAEIDKLIPLIEANEKELDVLSAEVEKSKAELEKMENKFKRVYESYCYRLRVMYISGDFNILSALLNSSDISSFLTRYEMIKSVSKSDAELLQEVNRQMDIIVTQQNGLDEKVAKYEASKKSLDDSKADYEAKQTIIENNSQAIAQKKTILAVDRAESDRLLAELTAQNQQYTEFRNEDEELIKAVENEIQALISGIKSPEEVTTAVAPDKKDSTSDQSIIAKSDVYSKSDAVLNMTYPVPNYYSLSAGFPNYSSGKYHGGIDFPCPTGSRIVAAQDGIVITVKRLDYSYGYYVMIYHGTDAKGRSVVTLYAHNSSIIVSNGQSVKKGQQIAYSGSTGNSTGPHCHFELRFNGARVNPKNYLSK